MIESARPTVSLRPAHGLAVNKTILITGATDGIGKRTAQNLATAGHRLLVHGRNSKKLEDLVQELGDKSTAYVADLSHFDQVDAMSKQILQDHASIDVIINNAGVFKVHPASTPQGLDLRFVVNTFAPYLLTQALLPVLAQTGRVVNLSSAAQALIDQDALEGKRLLADMEAYAQSKLAITIWSTQLAKEVGPEQVVVAINPGSLLASKMVKEGFGVAGKDLSIGAKILCEAATDESFAQANGKYFDNDTGRFDEPNPGYKDPGQIQAVMRGMESAISTWKG